MVVFTAAEGTIGTYSPSAEGGNAIRNPPQARF